MAYERCLIRAAELGDTRYLTDSWATAIIPISDERPTILVNGFTGEIVTAWHALGSRVMMGARMTPVKTTVDGNECICYAQIVPHALVHVFFIAHSV